LSISFLVRNTALFFFWSEIPRYSSFGQKYRVILLLVRNTALFFFWSEIPRYSFFGQKYRVIYFFGQKYRVIYFFGQKYRVILFLVRNTALFLYTKMSATSCHPLTLSSAMIIRPFPLLSLLACHDTSDRMWFAMF